MINIDVNMLAAISLLWKISESQVGIEPMQNLLITGQTL